MRRWLASLPTPLLGGLSASFAIIFFSINDMMIKFLSGGYALHELVLIRSALGLVIICAVIAPLTDGWSIMRTNKLPMHVLRGFCVVAANMTFFLGLAAMPLADAVAIFFISPLVITVFSVIFLGEQVGPRRWTAIFVGLLGVMLIVRPGTSAFQVASLLPMAAAVAYALIHILARRLGPTESAATMAFYIQVTFIIVCILIGLAIGGGRFADQSHPSLVFMFRAWSWPLVSDFIYFGVIGVGVAFGGYFISQAYRVAEAGFVAPFEYLAMPLAVLWGYLVFDELPDGFTWIGIGLIVGSGLFTVWRERKTGADHPSPKTRR